MFSHVVSNGVAVMNVSALCKGAQARQGCIDTDVSPREDCGRFYAADSCKLTDAASIGDDVCEVLFDERMDFACPALCLSGGFEWVVRSWWSWELW